MNISIVRTLLLALLIPSCAAPRAASSASLAPGGEGRRAPATSDEDALHRRAPHRDPAPAAQRIIGGSAAAAGRYSYTVALYDESKFFCAGVLVGRDVVLTAAHCAVAVAAERVGVFAGSHRLSDRGRVWRVTATWVHPRFDPATMEHDFAVYLLERPVAADLAAVVAVNADPRVPGTGRLTALGWGDTDPGPAFAGTDALRKARVEYVPNAQCRRRTGRVDGDLVRYAGLIGDAMACALGAGRDACQGDSGGPLVVEGAGGRGGDALVGLSSWGVACAHATLPGVYARASAGHAWIRARVCEGSRDPAGRRAFACGGPGPGPQPTPRPRPAPTPSKPTRRPTRRPKRTRKPTRQPKRTRKPTRRPKRTRKPTRRPKKRPGRPPPKVGRPPKVGSRPKDKPARPRAGNREQGNKEKKPRRKGGDSD